MYFQLWNSYFNLSVSFLTQTHLQLENFTEVKKHKIIDRYFTRDVGVPAFRVCYFLVAGGSGGGPSYSWVNSFVHLPIASFYPHHLGMEIWELSWALKLSRCGRVLVGCTDVFFLPLFSCRVCSRPWWRSKQRNGGHVGGVKYSFGDWTLFLCKFLLLFHYGNMASGHTSEHSLFVTFRFYSCLWVHAMAETDRMF